MLRRRREYRLWQARKSLETLLVKYLPLIDWRVAGFETEEIKTESLRRLLMRKVNDIRDKYINKKTQGL